MDQIFAYNFKRKRFDMANVYFSHVNDYRYLNLQIKSALYSRYYAKS